MSAKTAVVRQRRTLADGRRLICIVCPLCEHRHWQQADEPGHCPRRGGTFAIATTPTKKGT